MKEETVYGILCVGVALLLLGVIVSIDRWIVTGKQHLIYH